MITPDWYCFFCQEILSELRRLEQLATDGFDDSKKQEDLLREIWRDYYKRCAHQVNMFGVEVLGLICSSLYEHILKSLGLDANLFSEGLDWKTVKEEFDARS